MIGPPAMIGTPVQWIVIVGVAILLFAPHLLPVIARIAGRMAGREIQRRYGIRLKAAEPVRRVEPVDRVEPVEPASPVSPPPMEELPPVPRVAAELPAAQEDRPPPLGRRVPTWGVTAIVAGAAAVLLWLLLHAR